MIQGGDPLGSGRGGPGYTFGDECPPDGPSFDRPGLLAMANAGPDTNGSQFFVTVAPTKHLTGRHTIFGEVVEGYDVVESISRVDTDAMDRPPNDQRSVGAQLDRRLGRLRFLITAVQPPEMQGAGRAAHDDVGDLLGRCIVDLDPRPAPRVEDLGKAVQAARGVDAVGGLP